MISGYRSYMQVMHNISCNFPKRTHVIPQGGYSCINVEVYYNGTHVNGAIYLVYIYVDISLYAFHTFCNGYECITESLIRELVSEIYWVCFKPCLFASHFSRPLNPVMMQCITPSLSLMSEY